MMDETSRFITAFLVNALWEIPVIFLIVILCSRLIRRTAWAHQHILWALALILSATVPLLAPNNLAFSRARGVIDAEMTADGWTSSGIIAASDDSGSWLHIRRYKKPMLFNASLTWIVVGFYSGFILWRLSILYRAWRSANRLRRSTRTPLGSDTYGAVAELCGTRWRRDVLLLYSPDAQSPVTLGFRRPVIVFPKSSFSGMLPDDFAAAMNHELAHITRGDYLLNFILQVLYLPISFHPVAMLIKSHVDQTRELACDELAAEKSSNRIAYARSLLNIARSICPGSTRNPDYSLGLFEGQAFEKRIINLLKSAHLVPGNRCRVRTVLGLVLLVGGCLTLPSLSVQIANSANLPMNLQEFAGSWQGEFKGHIFITFNLKIEAGKLVGTCTHTISLEKNSTGELTRVDEKSSTDRILDSRLDANKLVLKIADNGDEQNAMECAFWLTSRNRGELEVVAPDDDKWKPWKLVRTSPALQ
jgi:beta-lactamase regulating signal transducer with metallopeptidase domain